MTKKHFVQLAAKLKTLRPIALSEIGTTQFIQWEFMCRELANFCQSQNAQFDRERFLVACGVKA